MKRILYLSFILPSLAVASSTISLVDISSVAYHENPEILAAQQMWKTKEAQIKAAKGWPDPTFTYIDEEIPSGMPGVENEKLKHLRIEQPVLFPGKLFRDAQMKHHEALIAEASYRTKVLEVLGDVRMRYYQLYLTDQKIDLVQESVDLLKNILRTAQSRVASGRSSTSDVYMVQTELGRAENALFEQQQSRRLIEIELNTLLNRKNNSALGRAEPPPILDLPLSQEDAEKLAQANAPLYLSAMHEVNHAQSMLKRNRLQFAPDFNLMAEREVAPAGEAGRQLGVSMTFPLWFRRPWNQIKEAKEHVLEAQASGRAMENMVLKNVDLEYTEVITHLTLARRISEEIIPSTESNVKITMSQYANDKADFLRLLATIRMWIESHNDYEDQLYHYGEHWTLLERWVGAKLTSGENHEQ